MVAKVTSLAAHKFLTKLAESKKRVQELSETAHNADNSLKGINDQLRRNVEAQKVLNRHLAASAKARVAKVLKFPSNNKE